MTSSPQFSPLTQYLGDWVRSQPTAGLAISVTDRRETLYAAGLGFADAEAQRPTLRSTTFQIGSIGKSMTALAVMQLADSGRLDLDAPLSSHLPWFAIPSRYGPITLRHVLSHTAGLPSGTDFAPAARYEGYALREAEAAWEPGSRFHYSNTGYKLLGWLLEDVTGLPYGEVMRRRVLEPLAMTATAPVIAHRGRHGMATGYVPLHDERPFRHGDTLIPAPWMEYGVGDGSQVSTAEDMARYVRFWLNGGRAGGRALVSPAAFARITEPSIRMNRGNAYQHDYGYGFGIISHRADGHEFIGHGGHSVGFHSIMLIDKTEGLGVTILCNGTRVDTYDPARYALQVVAALSKNQPAPEPPITPDPTAIADTEPYVGDYINPENGRCVSIRDAGQRLRLASGGEDCVLEHIAGNAFCVPHDAFDPFPLRFRRAGGNDRGQIAEVIHGPDAYVRRDGAPLDAEVPHPAEWTAFPGHYRSRTPYLTSFHIVLRRGRLFLAWPNGSEEALTPQEPDGGSSGWFSVGLPGTPTAERLRFDTVVGPRALRVQWTGGGIFYRVD